MKSTPISTIKIGDRQRKAFDEAALVELSLSIYKRGLLHPIVLMESKSKKTPYTLVAGERRLRAISNLFTEGKPISCDNTLITPGNIPYILITNTDKIALRETELEENLIREDLTWQERVLALDELHQLRIAQNPKQTDADTARELASVPHTDTTPAAENSKISGARREVARAKIIAPYLDDPAVKGAGSASKAFGVVAAKVEAEFMAELHQRGETQASEHTLIAGDLREEMKKLPGKYYTCIIADPPYGVGADKFGDVAELDHNYTDDRDTALNISVAIADLGYRICEDEAHLYLFCDVELFIELRDLIHEHTEWNCWRTPIIWSKGTGYAPQQSSGWQRTYELILFATKGRKPFGAAHKDIMEFAPDKNKHHAAGKPFQLYAQMMKQTCLPGDRVLDPCCGGGTVFSAAVAAGVTATGIENNSEYLEMARMRMNQDD